MHFYSQIFIVVLFAFLARFIEASPILKQIGTDPPEFILENVSEFPGAVELEHNTTIETHVIGKIEQEDLEVTTWVASLSELNFTFPPPFEEEVWP